MTVYKVRLVYGFYEEVLTEYYATEEEAERVVEDYEREEDWSASYTEVEVEEGEVELEEL